MMDSLYGNRKKLEAMFSFFDTNGDGVISTEEFHIGVEALNEGLQGKGWFSLYNLYNVILTCMYVCLYVVFFFFF